MRPEACGWREAVLTAVVVQTLFNKLSTVWSAPNYCYRCGNVASVLEIDEQLSRFFNVFTAAPGACRGPRSRPGG
jgi:hypothetical protein